MLDIDKNLAAAPKIQTVDLSEPIMRGETRIEKLDLRKPKAGELRGLSLTDLLTADISCIIKVLPRISMPSITDAEAANLELEDLAQCGGVIRGFFMTKAERAMMDQMIEEQQSKG
jgi:hypothetical protein